MLIENAMYFALGALVTALIGLVVLPAVWRRAVRLTKRRIEAATPITMAEFRADKDQLRAEFALSTRRLEMNVEQLRKRLAEQLQAMNRSSADVASIRAERERHTEVVRELEAREEELKNRVLDLERQTTDLSQRLRMRERELGAKSTEIETLRDTVRGAAPRADTIAQAELTGNYDEDIDRMVAAVAIEARRADVLEDQVRGLINQLQQSDKRTADANAAISQLHQVLSKKSDAERNQNSDLVAAEARIASAENRLTMILAETSQMVENAEGRADQLLADKLSMEEELQALRGKVGSVESTILADWDSERIEQAHLRERLNDIASHVSRLVYQVESVAPAQPQDTRETPVEEESLFDRVQRFAGEDLNQPAANEPQTSGRLTDRMEALRELQGR